MVSTTRTAKQGKSAADHLLSRLRTCAAPITSRLTRENKKAPIAEADTPTIRAHIEQNQPGWLLAFYDLSLATGWRTADVANLRYDCIDWESGSVTITVAKQTKAAQARAMSKGLGEIRKARQQAALAAGDAVAYMTWGAADRDTLAESASPAEVDRLAELVSSAKIKTSRKVLGAPLLARLAAMRDAAFWADGFVFSRALTSSNSSRLQSGAAITRQTVWARLRTVFDSLAGVVANAAKLSAYSLRKAFAVALYHATDKSVAAVMEEMGHSSEAMTMRYLGMDTEAAEGQARIAGAAV